MVEFRIADTFTDSLARLRADEQKAAKTTAFDLQVDPSRPGLRLHRVDAARDRNFWSVRAGRELRIIVHRTSSSFLICYVDHHDQAYRWAERRRLERHPRTGAAQLVEIQEIVREAEAPRYVQPHWAAPAGVVEAVPAGVRRIPAPLNERHATRRRPRRRPASTQPGQ